MTNIITIGPQVNSQPLNDNFAALNNGKMDNIFYNVKMYGAIGDGITDDTIAIQAANTAASLVGGAVEFPDGTYLVSRLTISSNVRFLAFGKATLKQSTYSGSMIYISGTGLEVSFDGLFFDGNNSAQVAESMNNIIDVSAVGLANDTFILSVTNCSFINQCFSSIRFDSDHSSVGNEFLYVYDCKFYGGNEGSTFAYDPRYITVIDGGKSIIDKCLFDLQKTPVQFGICGIALASTDTTISTYSSLTVTNCEFYNIGRRTTNRLGVIDYYIFGQNVVIENNKFYSSNTIAIKGKSESKNVSIRGNFIDSVAGTTDGGIVVNATVTAASEDNFIIDGNVIKNVSGSGISIDSLTTDHLMGVIISNNIIKSAASRGIEIHSCSDINIHHNFIDTTTLQGIWIVDSSGFCNIEGNIIKNTSSFGIYSETGVSAMTFSVINNNIKNATQYGIYLRNMIYLMLANNSVDTVTQGYSLSNSNAIVESNRAINTTTTATILSMLSTIEQNNTWNGKQYYGTLAPTTGTWEVGDKVWNTVPAASGYIGFVCTTAGTPGTWKGFGLIQA